MTIPTVSVPIMPVCAATYEALHDSGSASAARRGHAALAIAAAFQPSMVLLDGFERYLLKPVAALDLAGLIAEGRRP